MTSYQQDITKTVLTKLLNLVQTKDWKTVSVISESNTSVVLSISTKKLDVWMSRNGITRERFQSAIDALIENGALLPLGNEILEVTVDESEEEHYGHPFIVRIPANFGQINHERNTMAIDRDDSMQLPTHHPSMFATTIAHSVMALLVRVAHDLGAATYQTSIKVVAGIVIALFVGWLIISLNGPFWTFVHAGLQLAKP